MKFARTRQEAHSRENTLDSRYRRKEAGISAFQIVKIKNAQLVYISSAAETPLSTGAADHRQGRTDEVITADETAYKSTLHLVFPSPLYRPKLQRGC
jgi:hypothetical protein